MTDKRPIERTIEILKRGARSVTQVSYTELLDVAEAALANSFAAFFDAKAKWSWEVIGEARSPAGLAAHIRKEADECEKDPSDLVEWVDVAMIAMDGAYRFAGANGEAFVAAMKAKHETNLGRDWPDWRTVPSDAPLEHVRPGDYSLVEATPPAQALATMDALMAGQELAEMRADRDRWIERVKELEARIESATRALRP